MNVQVKRVSDELHAALKRRAQDRGISINDLLLEMLKRELARPEVRDWIADVRGLGVRADVDVERLMDDVRDSASAT